MMMIIINSKGDIVIAVITYNKPHRKTQDLLFQLKARGHKEVHVLAMPWENRVNFQPLYPHRPDVKLDINPKAFCNNLEYDFWSVDKTINADLKKLSPDYILIGGAGILDKSTVNKFKIYNSHPGYLPETRGLDALKWAIYKNLTIGVTLHIIDEYADAGKVVYKEKVPIKPDDTFDILAMRLYEREIEILATVPFEKNGEFIELSNDLYGVYRRMPHKTELQMMKRFKLLRDQVPDDWSVYG